MIWSLIAAAALAHQPGPYARACLELGPKGLSQYVAFMHGLAGESSDDVLETRQRVENLDAGNLYELMPYEKGAWRGLGIGGSSRGGKFSMKPADPGLATWVRSADPLAPRALNAVTAFGDTTLAAFAKKAGDDGFDFALHARVGMQDLLLENVPRVMAAFLSAFAADRSGSLIPGIISEFPRTWTVLTRFVEIKRFASEDSHLFLDSRLKAEAFEADFPHVFEVLEKLRGVASGQAVIRDAAGEVARMSFDAATFTYSSQSRLALDLTSSTPHPYTLEADGVANISGIRIATSGLKTKFQWTALPSGPNVRLAYDQPPLSLKVSGYALGFIPVWMIDAVIPGDMQGLMTSFLTRLTAGPGLRAVVGAVPESAPMERSLGFGFGAEILSNGLLRFALDFQAKAGLLSPELRQEIRQVAALIADAFAADLELPGS